MSISSDKRPIQPQPGPQTIAALSTADIVFYGGKAGSGKSWLMAYLAARYHHVPGYLAAIVRKNLTQLTGPGGIWSEAVELYPKLGGRHVASPHLMCTFSCGQGRPAAKVYGKHVENENKANLEDAFQGFQFAFLGVDEGTQIRRESTFWYMWGRCRTTTGLRPQMFVTCNPDPDSWVRRLVDWWIGPEGFAIRERSGVLRYCFRDPENEDLRWFATKEEALAALPSSMIEGKTPEQIAFMTPSVTFVHGDLEDNKILLEKDPGYAARLAMLPRAERARLGEGNWNTRPTRGDFFQRGMFRRLPTTEIERRLNPAAPVVERDGYRFVRCWDRAATAVQGNLAPVPHAEDFVANPPGSKRADWSSSVLMCECLPPKGTTDVGPRYVILDVRRYQDTPGAIRLFMKEQALLDGPHVKVALFLDPAQAGIDQIENDKRFLRGVAQVVVVPTAAPGSRSSGDPTKQRNAKPLSETLFDGRVYYDPRTCDPTFLAAYFNELEAYPDTDKPKAERAHDDWVDASSGAFRALTELAGAWGGPPLGVPTPGEYRPPNMPAESRIHPKHWDDGEASRRISGLVGFKRGGF